VNAAGMNGPAPAAPVPAGILVTALAPEQPGQFLVTPIQYHPHFTSTETSQAKIL